jgi:hypothetical protein
VLAGPWVRNELWRRARAVPSLDLRFAESKSLVDSVSGQNLITFTRASTKMVTNSQGVLESVGIDVPAFDHNPLTGECLGLLPEEQRQNLLTWSEEFDNAAWTPLGILAFGSGSTANATAAPNGTTTADLLTEDTSTGEHRVSTGSVVWVGSTTYTFSIFAKSNGRARLDFFGVGGGNFTGGREADFNLATGTVTSTDGATASIQTFANGWYRLRMTFVTSAAPSASNIFIRFSDALGNFSYTGDGTSGIYLWGAQLEAGAFPTSYIPTTGTAATRTADVVSISGTNFSSWYRQDEGCVFADWLSTGASGFNTVYNFNAGAFIQNIVEAYRTNNEISVTGRIRDASGSSDTINVSVASWTNTRHKAAHGIALNNAAFCLNGGTVGTDTVVNLPTPTALNIGADQAFNATKFLSGTIRRLTFWPTRLPNSTLQSITQ